MQKEIANPQPSVASGDYAIFEDQNRLYFANYQTRGLYITCFVLGLLGVITLINGAVQLFSYPQAGILLLGIGLVFFLVFTACAKRLRARKSKNWEHIKKIAIIDLNKQELQDGNGQTLAPLSSVSFGTAFQATDSSRAIQATWPKGSLTLVRGMALAGGAGAFIDFLKKKGLMK